MKKLILALFFLPAGLAHAVEPCKGGDGSGGGKTQPILPIWVKDQC